MAKRNPKRDTGAHSAGVPSTAPGPKAPHPALGKKARDWSRILTVFSGAALVGFVVVAYVVLPDEVAGPVKVLLGLVNAGLAVLVYVFATTERSEKDRLLRRLRRGQHIDFGRELRLAHRERRKVRLPMVGETSLRTLGGVALFAMVFAWWLTPWAPVAVKGIPIPDVSAALGEEIMAVVLGMPDAQVGTALPPVIPPPLVEKVAVISPDPEESRPFDRAMRALVESSQAADPAAQRETARALLDEAMAASPRDKLPITVARAQIEIFAGNFARALGFYQQAVQLKADDPLILGQTAVAWMLAGNRSPADEGAEPATAQVAYVEAEALTQKACKLAEKLPEDDPRRALCMHLHAALIIARSQDFQEAEELSKNAQEMWEGLSEDVGDHPFIAASCNNLAVMNLLRALYTAPTDLNDRAARAWRDHYGETSVLLAASYGNTAMFHYTMGNYAEAQQYNDLAREIRSDQLPAGHPAVAMSLALDAQLALVRGDYAEAEPPAQQALDGLRAWFGDKHPNVAAAYGILGRVYLHQARYNLAQKQLDRRGTLEVAEEVFRPEHPYLAVGELNLARFRITRGCDMRAQEDYRAMSIQYNDARLSASKALKTAEERFQDRRDPEAKHPIVADARDTLGRLQLLMREEYLRQAQLGENTEGNETKARLMFGQARAHLDSALRIRRELFEKTAPNHPAILESEAGQAALSACTNVYTAIDKLRDVIQKTKEARGEDHPAVASLLQELGMLYFGQKAYAQAKTALAEALQIRRARLEAFSHPKLAATLESYADALVADDPSQAEQANKLRTEAANLRIRHRQQDRE